MAASLSICSKRHTKNEASLSQLPVCLHDVVSRFLALVKSLTCCTIEE